MEQTQKRSDTLAAALKMMDDALREYRIAYESVGNQDKLECDILHRIELSDNYDERCKSATELKNCLKERRYHKDITEETKPIVDFMENPQNKKAYELMKKLLGEIRKAESYHANRNYKPRMAKE